jgi:hypothetical protein
LVLVFSRPVLVKNSNAKVTRTVFGPRGREVPVVAPEEQQEVIAVMACVSDVRDARAAFLPSGRLRALKVSDFSRPEVRPGARPSA